MTKRLAMLAVPALALGACLTDVTAERGAAGVHDDCGGQEPVCASRCLDEYTREFCWSDGTRDLEDCGEMIGYRCVPDGGFDPATGEVFATCSPAPAVGTCNTCLDIVTLHACWDSGLEQVIDCSRDGGMCVGGVNGSFCDYPDPDPSPPEDPCNTCLDPWILYLCWEDGSDKYYDCAIEGGRCESGYCVYP